MRNLSRVRVDVRTYANPAGLHAAWHRSACAVVDAGAAWSVVSTSMLTVAITHALKAFGLARVIELLRGAANELELHQVQLLAKQSESIH